MRIVLSFIILLFSQFILAANKTLEPTILQVKETNITVNGKNSQVFSITQPNGTFGYRGKKGQWFDVIVQNKTHVPLVLHWHGIIDPNSEDGVPFVTQFPIPPGGEYHYQFLLKQAGTFWLHSHYKLQEQKLMAAPLIIEDDSETISTKEVLMFIQDFTFANPKIIYERLRKQLVNQVKPMKMDSQKPDVTDVKFDAYLTNHRTLQNPEVIRVALKETLRLRIINASASSNYYIDLGKLTGKLIAVDGALVQPIEGQRFQIAIGNRLDVLVTLPAGQGVYPILALPEGTRQQTGLILATQAAILPKYAERTNTINPTLDYAQELKLAPFNSIAPRAIDQSLKFNLAGDMQTYRWTINGQAWPFITPYVIKSGQRVEMVFDNQSMMAHPMHFHGHIFQIIEINGKKVNGRLGDTIDVMPHSTVKVIFDADNSGIWVLHCHVLYHQQGGMMTTINYQGYPDRFTTKQREAGDRLYYLSPFSVDGKKQ